MDRVLLGKAKIDQNITWDPPVWSVYNVHTLPSRLKLVKAVPGVVEGSTGWRWDLPFQTPAEVRAAICEPVYAVSLGDMGFWRIEERTGSIHYQTRVGLDLVNLFVWDTGFHITSDSYLLARVRYHVTVDFYQNGNGDYEGLITYISRHYPDKAEPTRAAKREAIAEFGAILASFLSQHGETRLEAVEAERQRAIKELEKEIAELNAKVADRREALRRLWLEVKE